MGKHLKNTPSTIRRLAGQVRVPQVQRLLAACQCREAATPLRRPLETWGETKQTPHQVLLQQALREEASPQAVAWAQAWKK